MKDNLSPLTAADTQAAIRNRNILVLEIIYSGHSLYDVFTKQLLGIK